MAEAMMLWGTWVFFRGFEYSCEEKRTLPFCETPGEENEQVGEGRVGGNGENT